MIDFKTKFSRRELLWFGPLFGLFAGMLGTIATLRFGAPGVARWIWVGAAAVIAIYYAVPPLRRSIYIGWLALVFPLGWLISHVLLCLVFYLVVSPIGLLLKLFRHDPLRRRFDPEASSYWIERGTPREPKSYFRQF